MALNIGWSSNGARQPRESAWAFDDAIDWAAMDEERQRGYWRDADLAHCAIVEGKAPTRITYRALTLEERAAVRGLATSRLVRGADETDDVWHARLGEALNGGLVGLLAFRAGVRFPEYEGTVEKPGDARAVYERGMWLLPSPFVERLTRAQGDLLITFYGGLVWRASTLDEAEKSEPHRDGEPRGVVG